MTKCEHCKRDGKKRIPCDECKKNLCLHCLNIECEECKKWLCTACSYKHVCNPYWDVPQMNLSKSKYTKMKI